MLRKIISYFFLFLLLFNFDENTQVIASEPDSNEVVTYKFDIKLEYGTQRVQIHGTRQFLHFSQMVKQILTTSGITLFDYFEYVSEDTLHINLSERATLANGSATVIPDTIINLNLVQALGTELLTADYNFIEGLVLHELTHILQLDQTRGFLSVTSAIFGSWGKWGLATPRWFIEGIGVWAESKFTSGGRLKNKMMTAMLYKNILDPNFCQDVSCFDKPGVYPFGSHAYWIGGHFIDYLENLKSGTVRCLIESNSRKFPFFLNSSFRLCTGKEANKHFQDYRNNLVLKAKEHDFSIENKSFYKKLKKIPVFLDSTLLSKNFHIINDEFIRMEHHEDEEMIVSTHLEKFTHKTYKSSHHIEQLLAPTIFDQLNKNIPIMGYPYLSMEVKRESSHISLKNGHEIIRENSKSSSYSFSSKTGTIFLKFNGLNWEIYKEKSLLYKFPEFLSLYNPTLIGHHLYYTSYYQGKNNTDSFKFERIDLRKAGRGSQIILSKSRPFSYMANDETYFLFSNKKTFWLVNIKTQKMMKYRSDYLDDIAAIRFSKNKTIVHFTYDPKSFYLYNGNIILFLKSLKKKRVKVKYIKLSFKNQDREEHSLKKVDQEQLGYYPNISLFRPHAWFFYINSGTTDYNFLIAKTSIADPRGHHDFGVSFKYYYDLSKVAPSLSYTYMPNDFTIFTAYDKDYSASKYDIEDVEEEVTLAGTGYKFDDQRLILFPKIYFAKENEIDFLGTRKYKSYNFSLVSAFARVNSDDLFQITQSEVIYSKRDPKDHKEFEKLDVTLETKLRLTYSLGLNLKGSYAKLYKDGYKSGVIFAGGAQERHSFMGIGSTDAYGNEVSTFRGEFNFAIGRPALGRNFVPLYLRELHLILGEEMLIADSIKYDSFTYKNNHILGTYIGLRTKLNIVYHAGIDLDFIITKVNAPNDGKGGYEFNLRLMSGAF